MANGGCTHTAPAEPPDAHLLSYPLHLPGADAGSAHLGRRRDERTVDAPVALEDVLGEEDARPELRDPQVEHTHACHEAISVAVPIVGPIGAELVGLSVNDGGNHLHGKQHEQRLDVHHPVRQLRHRYGPSIASDSISIAVTVLSQNPYYGIQDSTGTVLPFSTAGRLRIYINIPDEIEIISHIKTMINTYFFNAQDHCMRPALINAK